MSPRSTPVNHLLRCYHAFLTDYDSANFIANVAQVYSIATLSRLAYSQEVLTRRATALALGMIGTIAVNDVLGHLLSDSDRKVRVVADDSMKSIWQRACLPRHRQQLSDLAILMDANQFEAAITLADALISQNDQLPDALSQRGAAKFQLQDYRAALADCFRVVELNRFHYIAWVGMGHCYLELSQPLSALDCFRHAVDLYPDLEPVRLQIRRLERAFQDPS